MPSDLDSRLYRVEGNQAKTQREVHEIHERLESLDEWLRNGFGKHVANMVRDGFMEFERDRWEREREEQRLQLEHTKEENRVYGQQRDHKAKITISIIGLIGMAISALIGKLL